MELGDKGGAALRTASGLVVVWPPAPVTGKPAQALQPPKQHKYIQILKRVLYPQCMEEGVQMNAGNSDNLK